MNKNILAEIEINQKIYLFQKAVERYAVEKLCLMLRPCLKPKRSCLLSLLEVANEYWRGF